MLLRSLPLLLSLAALLVQGCQPAPPVLSPTTPAPGVAAHTADPTGVPTAIALQPTAAPAFPVTVATCGVPRTYTQAPRRVVAADTSALETLLALGLDDRIVAWYGGANVNLAPEFRERAERLNKLGPSFPYPTLEAILGSNPDFVFTYGYNERGGLTLERLTQLGIGNYSVEEVCPTAGRSTLESFYNNVLDLGKIFGVESRARDLVASYRKQIADARARVPGGRPAPRVYFVGPAGFPNAYTFAGGSLFNDLVTTAGGQNVFGDQPSMNLRPSWEEVIARSPEVILVSGDEGTVQRAREFFASNPSFAVVPAIQQDRLAPLKFLETVPGPQAISAVSRIVDILHGPGR